MTINITEVSTELSGYCDIETGECITTEPDTSDGATAENIAPTGDDVPTVVNDSDNR